MPARDNEPANAAVKRANVTSVDVARRAGVSQSTVSRAFSKVPTRSGVSEEARRKILRAADELGYRPNALARSLITHRTRIVGVLFSYLDNLFYANALELICHGLQRQGYHALVFMMPDTLADVEATVSDILQYQVDGLITASVELSSQICEHCYEQGIPVVMLNRVQDNPLLSSVTTDNVGGGRLAAGALVSAGCQRIGLIAGWKGASTSRDREFGFIAELAARGFELFSRGVGHFDLAQTEAATREMFDRPAEERPDGVFVVNDYMAVRAMDVMRFSLGLKIPEDVSVVGFDDTAMAGLPTYGLTTVRQPVRPMVDSALRLLFQRMNAADLEPEHIILGARLVVRKSVKR
jgi:DNA-binding LacI/PurR family transcriptional regulator